MVTAMTTEFLIRWGPLMIMLLSVAAPLAQSHRQRRESSSHDTLTLGATDGAHAFVRGVIRRALSVMLLYFSYRAVFPQSEQNFGRIDWLVMEAFRLSGLGLSFLSAVWLVTTQIVIGEHWGVGVPANALPWLANSGPFTVSRNPVFLGVVGEAVGLFLTSPTATTLMALTAIWLGAQVQIRLEEISLQATYGSDYVAYCKSVRRWL